VFDDVRNVWRFLAQSVGGPGVGQWGPGWSRLLTVAEVWGQSQTKAKRIIAKATEQIEIHQ